MGSARSLSRDVCQGIRAVLANGAHSAVTLSRRAKLSLTTLTEDMGLAPQTQSLVTQDEQGPRTWTFAGTRENRTLAHQAGQGGVKVRFDALSVRIPFGVQLDVGTAVGLNDQERAALGDGIKFHACVPDRLLDRTIIARLFSVPMEM
jgi:ATP-dependent Lhr-like helicase